MEWLFILGFALSSSIDNFGVGISYGVRKVRIKWLSNLLIAAICFLFSIVGIMFGRWVSTILPGVFHVIVAVVLLTLIGIRIILLVGSQRNNGSDELDSSGQENVRYIGWIESSVLGVAPFSKCTYKRSRSGFTWFIAFSYFAYISIWQFYHHMARSNGGEKSSKCSNWEIYIESIWNVDKRDDDFNCSLYSDILKEETPFIKASGVFSLYFVVTGFP